MSQEILTHCAVSIFHYSGLWFGPDLSLLASFLFHPPNRPVFKSLVLLRTTEGLELFDHTKEEHLHQQTESRNPNCQRCLHFVRCLFLKN